MGHGLNEIDPTIIKIGEKCKNHGAQNHMISSILTKKDDTLNRKIEEVNYKVEKLCQVYNFTFISNNHITTRYLYKGGIHLNDFGTNMLGGNFVNYIENQVTTDHTNQNNLY